MLFLCNHVVLSAKLSFMTWKQEIWKKFGKIAFFYGCGRPQLSNGIFFFLRLFWIKTFYLKFFKSYNHLNKFFTHTHTVNNNGILRLQGLINKFRLNISSLKSDFRFLAPTSEYGTANSRMRNTIVTFVRLPYVRRSKMLHNLLSHAYFVCVSAELCAPRAHT